MVQARVLRKHNVDLHYNNALFSFMKKRAKKYVDSTTFVTADAKCKVSVGEPGFPIAAVARGKQVIVAENEVMAVGDHDFSKLSLIPDAILIHEIPSSNDSSKEIPNEGISNENLNEDIEPIEKDVQEGDQRVLRSNVVVPSSSTKVKDRESEDAIGSWYTGQCYYGVKNMITQGSTAIRCTTELAKTIQQEHCIKPRLYVFNGDRNITNLAVQKNIVSVFLKLDLDEAVFARTAANCSFRNPVERMHAIANIGLQAVGIMRGSMSDDSENKLKTFGGNVEIRTACETDRDLLSEVTESLEKPKQIIETVLSNLSLKGKPFKIYQPVEEDEIQSYIDALKRLEPNIEHLFRKRTCANSLHSKSSSALIVYPGPTIFM